MDDVIDFALMRHGELAEAIEKREAEIAKMREEKESLELFVCTHKELSERAASERKKDRDPEEPKHEERKRQANPAVPQIMPVRQAKSA